MQNINPYATPKAEVHDANLKPKRPAWVWVISVYYMFAAAGATLSMMALFSGAVPLTETQKQYFASLGTVDYAFSFLIMAVNVVAAVQLFRLRSLSFYLFLSSFLLNLVLAAWHAANHPSHEAVRATGFTGSLFGWGISVAICWYTWRLAKTGVLK